MKTSAIQSTTKPQYSTAKKVVKTAVAAAAATGTVLYMAKTGKLNPVEGGNKTIEAIKAGLKKPADKVLTKAQPLIAQAKEKVSNFKVSGRVMNSKLYKDALNKFSSLKEAHPQPLQEAKGYVTKTAGKIADKVKSKINSQKFGM